MSIAPGVSSPGQPAALAASGLHVELSAPGTPRVLYLHAEYGPRIERPFTTAMGGTRPVAVGHHPGFGASGVNSGLTSVLDVAFAYLSYLDTLPEGAVVDLVGSSLGGWMALHIATMYGHRLRKLVLLNPLGVKLTPPHERDFADLFALPDDHVARIAFCDASKAPFTGADLSDEDILERAAAREALVRYGWEPYLHDKALKTRLDRIQVPTLLVT